VDARIVGNAAQVFNRGLSDQQACVWLRLPTLVWRRSNKHFTLK
jgi:hypothetical protein